MRRSLRVSRWVVGPLLALLSGGLPAGADSILQVESFTISSLPGMAQVAFDPFDPALGTLDRVGVSFQGTFTTSVLLAPNQVVLPIIDLDVLSLGPLGFDFDSSARFIFALITNSGAVTQTFPVATGFFLSFALTSTTDLAGFAVASGSATGASFLPATVAARREDFELLFPGLSVQEQMLWLPPMSPGGPFAGGGSMSLEYQFTPAAAAAVPEPSSMLLLGTGLLALGLAGSRLRR